MKKSCRLIPPIVESIYDFESLSGYREIFAFSDDHEITYLVRVKASKCITHNISNITLVKIGYDYTLRLATSNRPIKIKPDMELFGQIDEEWYIDPTDNPNGPKLIVRNGKMYGAYTSPDLVNIEGVLYIRKECAKHE
jgi:hypothetical protein